MKLLVAGTAISGPQRRGMTMSAFSWARVELRLFTRQMCFNPGALSRRSSTTSMTSLVSPLWLMVTSRSWEVMLWLNWLRYSPGSRGTNFAPQRSLKNMAPVRAAL